MPEIGTTYVTVKPVLDTSDLTVVGENVPRRARFVLYLVALTVGALATAATTITAAVAPDAAMTVAAIGGALTGLASTIAGGLGAVYLDRPLPEAGEA